MIVHLHLLALDITVIMHVCMLALDITVIMHVCMLALGITVIMHVCMLLPSADHLLSQQSKNLDSTKDVFLSLAQYLSMENQADPPPPQPGSSGPHDGRPPQPGSSAPHGGGQSGPDALFGIWATFLDNYKQCWKDEQRRVAREMFARVEMKRKVKLHQYCNSCIPADFGYR